MGEPGVGKTAIIEGLAQRVIKKDVPRLLHNKRILSLDLAGLIAGTKYRGQFEERMKTIMTELENNNDLIIGIIGLGYVGLPLAVSLAKYFKTVGFDTNYQRRNK